MNTLMKENEDNKQAMPDPDLSNLDRQLLLLTVNTSEPLVIVGRDLQIITFNSRFKEQYAFFFGKEIREKTSILEYALADSLPELKKIYKDVFKGQCREKEYTLPIPGKESCTFLGNYQPLYGAEGQILGACVLLTNITDKIRTARHLEANEYTLKSLNEALEKRAEELSRSNAELEQFAYAVSHDLQEPLRMVTSFLIQLEHRWKGKLDKTSAEYIHFATDGALRMRKMIFDLLEYAQVGRKLEMDDSIDTEELVRESVHMNRVLIAEKKAQIQWGKLPTLSGHRSTLFQVFHNLLSNALKYHEPGQKPVITINASETPSHWQFTCKDNGIGIGKEFFDKIFVVFQRLHHKNEYSGTGIGLAICKRIVENHKGDIWIESKSGQGSTFYFTLIKKR